jgi:hypothetical protein
MGGISQIGDRTFSGTLGFENNELHRKIWVNDPLNNLVPLMQSLFGTNVSDGPQALPEPFDKFFAWSASFESEDRGSQGDGDDIDAVLAGFPIIRGGVMVDITYRPLDNMSSFVDDEAWDFSAQTMSLIGNNFGQNPQSLTWSDGTAITNITAIVKIIPKIDFVQTQVFQDSTPNQTQIALVGRVNAGTLFAGTGSFQGTQNQWAEHTVLLTGLPVVRRWRFDGQPNFQWGIKLAINTYQDKIEDNSTDFVTWNRLYRPEKGYWDRVLIGPNSDPLYPEDDLSQVVG